MPRKPMDGKRIGDLMKELSLAAVMQWIPMEAAQKALRETQTESERERRLPAHLIVYLVIMLALFSDVSVGENLRILWETFRRRFQVLIGKPPVDGAISKARNRLKSKPFRFLFSDVAKPLSDKSLSGCFQWGFRLVAADGTSVDVQHTTKNIDRFGIHTNQHGEVGYPALQAVILMECGTRVPFGAVTGGVHDDEGALFDGLTDRLSDEMLLLVDRGLYSFARWKTCAARCGALVWRIRSTIKPTIVKRLPDGSVQVILRPSGRLIRKGLAEKGDEMTARIIEYVPRFSDGSIGKTTRLLTTLLSHERYPAMDLAKLYAERWVIETGFGELKTHLKGRHRILRSPLPDLVEQEFFGFLLAYYVIRATLTEAGRKHGIPPNGLSFVHSVRVIRRKLVSPPSD